MLRHPRRTRRLDDQRSAGDRRVVAGRGIILPNIRGVPVLPFAQYDVLHVGRQRDLRGRYCAVRIVFEYLCAADPCGLRVFARLDQGEENIRRGVGSQPVVRIQIGDVGDIGQQSAAHACQLVGTDRQHVAAYGFARSQRCFGSRALPALPCYRDRTVCQRNRHLVSVNHGRNDEFARRARPVRCVVPRVYIVDLRTGLIHAQIGRLRFAVRKINDRLGPGCDDRHDDFASNSQSERFCARFSMCYLIYSSRKMRNTAFLPSNSRTSSPASQSASKSRRAVSVATLYFFRHVSTATLEPLLSSSHFAPFS